MTEPNIVFKYSIQETSTKSIILCIQKKNIGKHNCDDYKKSLMDIKIEFNKRFGMPFYIPLIALVCCFLLASRKDRKFFYLNKYIYFGISFIILTLAEILVRY